MTTDFLIPTTEEISLIAQDLLPTLQQGRLIYDIMPIVEENTDVVAWEQEDDFKGLQQLRGVDGATFKVNRDGPKRFVMRPGVYGEHTVIPEEELISRRATGSLTNFIDLTDLTGRDLRRLLIRELDRIELIGWTLYASGTFSVVSPTGGVTHGDSFSVQTFTATVPWATAATATPLADLSSVQQLSGGHSVNFGAAAMAIMNRATFNAFRSNTNAADLYGRRTQGLGTFNNLVDLNALTTGDDLPTVRVYDRGYKDDAGTFHRFIPNNVVIVVGKRDDGGNVAEYKVTRNASNPGSAPGPFTTVEDNESMPRIIKTVRGQNGGPAIYFPSAIVHMQV